MSVFKPALIAACFLCLCGAPVDGQPYGDPEIIRAKPLREAPEDGELMKLKKRRYNEALAEVHLSYKLYSQSVLRHCPVEAARRLQKAGVEVYGRKEGASFLGNLVGYADSLEKILDTIMQRGGRENKLLKLELHQVRQFRLDVEIQKRKLELGLK
jgi:hypothetical protein